MSTIQIQDTVRHVDRSHSQMGTIHKWICQPVASLDYNRKGVQSEAENEFWPQKIQDYLRGGGRKRVCVQGKPGASQTWLTNCPAAQRWQLSWRSNQVTSRGRVVSGPNPQKRRHKTLSVLGFPAVASPASRAGLVGWWVVGRGRREPVSLSSSTQI